jgi:hypothetical protein
MHDDQHISPLTHQQGHLTHWQCTAALPSKAPAAKTAQALQHDVLHEQCKNSKSGIYSMSRGDMNIKMEGITAQAVSLKTANMTIDDGVQHTQWLVNTPVC